MIAALLLMVAVVTPSCWSAPVESPVVDGFRAPACTWCPGHRGLEYRLPMATPVHAVAAGTVTFAGTVVGTKYLVIEVLPGRKVTYGMLADLAVGVGDRVAQGQAVGRSTRRLFLGVRQGNHYLDPAPLLGRRLGPLRLVPIDRRAARPAGSSGTACASRPPPR